MVEIIPKKSEKALPLSNISLFVAGAMLLVAVFGYVILLRSEAQGLSAIQDLEASISKAAGKDDKNIEEKIFNYEEKIKDFKNLRAGQQKSSKFFDNFGRLIHPQIWFSSLNFDIVGMRALL